MIDNFINILKIIFKRIYGIFISIILLILSYYFFFDLGQPNLNTNGSHYRGKLFDGIFLKIEDSIPNSKYFFSLLFFFAGCYIIYLILRRIFLEKKEV